MNQEEISDIRRMNIVYSSMVGLWIFGFTIALYPTTNISKLLVIGLISSYFALWYRWVAGEKTAMLVLKKPFKDKSYYEKYAKV